MYLWRPRQEERAGMRCRREMEGINTEENEGGKEEPTKARKVRDESVGEDESELDLRNHLRDDILESVDECLSAWEKGRAPAARVASDPLHRCVVCTLPHGSCKHTQQWLYDRHRRPILDSLPKDNVDLAMDDISDVLTPASPKSIDINFDAGDPSLANLRWETLSPQPADELSGNKVDLSSPSSRSGHTMVLFKGAANLLEDTRILVIFGGISSPGSESLDCGQHSSTAATNESHLGDRGINDTERPRNRQHTLHYHTDTRIFNIGLNTWHCPDASGDVPAGRYGHVALALDGETMWVFGGRLEGGQQTGDTYTLNVCQMRWEKTNVTSNGDLCPAPRYWSAAVKVGHQIVLFGGADLLNGRVFDDVWTWDVPTRSWTEQIVVGTPPLARYGHALVACSKGQILVLGGCCVSTSAEQGIPVDNDRLHRRVRVAASRVDRAYELEEAEIAVGAIDLYSELGGSVPGRECRGLKDDFLPSCASERERWRNLSRRQAQLAAAIAARESDTNSREAELRQALFEQAAMTHWAKLSSFHPFKALDVMFLDTESMIWGVSDPPPVGGGRTTPPSARMHFSAVLLSRKVVLWGGCLPTSKRVDIVEGGVHVYDLDHRRWSTWVGKRHPEGVRARLEGAVGQLGRAERALFDAKQRAMALGSPGGRTMQVVQAEAIIEVNRWRVKNMEREIQSAIPSPRPRAAHAGCAIGHRIMYFGGWGEEIGREKGTLLVLDIEQPSEKERRLEEEFHLRLERERQQRENAEAEALRKAARLEDMRKNLELAREAAETTFMMAEDARSAVPELTIAPTPRLRYANSTTLWLEWDRPAADAVGKPPDRRVQYTLYMRGGFREWEVGDDVLVEFRSRAQRRAAGASESTLTTCSVGDAGSFLEASLVGGDGFSTTPGDGANAADGAALAGESQRRTLPNERGHGEVGKSSGGSDPAPEFMPAVITDTGGAADGVFDIRWNDGERERAVRRNRIHRGASSRPPWAVVYQGWDCRYAVEGMVPEAILERERKFPYEVSAEFSLQTKGAEVPRDKLSRHSPVVAFKTNFEGQGPVRDLRRPEKGGGLPASVKARLATAKALDDSISASDGSSTRSSLPGTHSLYGQFVATGKGGLYL